MEKIISLKEYMIMIMLPALFFLYLCIQIFLDDGEMSIYLYAIFIILVYLCIIIEKVIMNFRIKPNKLITIKMYNNIINFLLSILCIMIIILIGYELIRKNGNYGILLAGSTLGLFRNLLIERIFVADEYFTVRNTKYYFSKISYFSEDINLNIFNDKKTYKIRSISPTAKKELLQVIKIHCKCNMSSMY